MLQDIADWTVKPSQTAELLLQEAQTKPNSAYASHHWAKMMQAKTNIEHFLLQFWADAVDRLSVFNIFNRDTHAGISALLAWGDHF